MRTKFKDPKGYSELCEAARDAAQALLDGAKDPILAIREIVAVRYETKSELAEFLPFEGFYSETDGVHRGEIRKQYSDSLLKRVDKEADVFLEINKDDISVACEKLIGALGSEICKLPSIDEVKALQSS